MAKDIGIFGGTFDPIHFGHLVCAENALKALGLDEVIFMPAGNPSFKQGKRLADGEDRLRMCRLACRRNPQFSVSPMELNREGVTYTIDTISELEEQLGKGTRIYFIIGSDAFLTVPKWKKAKKLIGKVEFAVLLRPGDSLAEVLRVIEDNGITARIVECPLLDISSSYIRSAVARGRAIRYLTPDDVCDYIHAHDLYLDVEPEDDQPKASGAGIIDIDALKVGESVSPALPEQPKSRTDLEDPFSQRFYLDMQEKLKGRVSEKRMRHIEGVADTAEMLARAYGVDPVKARLAGLLHDWDKGLTDEQLRERVDELGIIDQVTPWVVENMPPVLHGPTAAAALAREYPQIPSDIIEAIRVHTTAKPDMSELDKVIYIADAIEPNRNFAKLPDLQAQVGELSLDDLFFEVYKFWTMALIEHAIVLHPDTIRIWNAIAEPRMKAKNSGGRISQKPGDGHIRAEIPAQAEGEANHDGQKPETLGKDGKRKRKRKGKGKRGKG